MRRFGPMIQVPAAMLVISAILYAYSRVIVGDPHWDHGRSISTLAGFDVGATLAILAELVSRANAHNNRTQMVWCGLGLVMFVGLAVYYAPRFVSGHDLRFAMTAALGLGAVELLFGYLRPRRITVR